MKYFRNFCASSLLYLLILLCMTLMTNACMKSPMLAYHSNYFDAMGSEAIGNDIIRLETAIDQDPEDSGSASYFHLALLYAHYNNPTPNYPRSLSTLRNYLLLYPEGREKDEVLYLKTLVQKLVKTDKERNRLAKEAAKLNQNNINLIHTNAELAAENQNLEDTIKKLKLLELTLEEKRLHLK